MMNGYSSIGRAMQQAGPSGQCRCQQRCVCQPGRPCRCSSGCSCSHAASAAVESRTRNWIEAGEYEVRPQRNRAYGSAVQRARARSLLQQRQARQADWARRTRLNGMFARRFNWGPQMGQVGRAIGSPTPRPDSQRLMFALARWQRQQGLPPTGILTPALWRRLQALLRARPAVQPVYVAPYPAPYPAPHSAPQPAAYPGPAGGQYAQPDAQTYAPPAAAPFDPQPEPQFEPQFGQQPDAAAGGVAGPAPDDAALPLPGDPGEPGGESNEYAPIGFRSRHPYAYQAMGQP